MLDPGMLQRPIAHRGLHDTVKGVVENTAPAFEAAVAKGYGIECDIRSAADGLPLVFHDAALGRLVEETGPVATLAPDHARQVRFRNAPITGILTFEALLDLVDGRVPVFAEIKSEWRDVPNLPFLGEIARLAATYTGRLAFMSFDPAVMVVLRELAPGIPRGLVASPILETHEDDAVVSPLSDARRRALADLEESAAVAPSFYAYDVRALPTPVTERVRATERLPVLAWTVRTEEQRHAAAHHADAAIFEGYEA